MTSVTTLALGSRPRQRGCKVAGQKEAWESKQRGCKVAGQKEARSQGKGVARVRAKKKPESHVTYSQECKKV